MSGSRPTTDPTVGRISGSDEDNQMLWEAYNVGTPDDVWAGTGMGHLFVTHFGRSALIDYWLIEYPQTAKILIQGQQPIPGQGIKLPQRRVTPDASAGDHPVS